MSEPNIYSTAELLGVRVKNTKPDWSELLRDSRWERLRAATVRKHPFCKSCRQRGRILNVHHPVYDGRKPWEYSTEELVVLCTSCHEGIHQSFKVARSMLSNMNANDAKALMGLLIELRGKRGDGFIIRTLANSLR